MKTLQSPRCTLEPQVAAHAPEMFVVMCDPAIYEFEGVPPPSLELLEAGLRRRESRWSPDGTEQWLNWVVRLPNVELSREVKGDAMGDMKEGVKGELTGYVQSTVLQSGAAYVAYEFSSRFWRQGLGYAAVGLMLLELVESYGVHTFVAALKTRNVRSMGLLTKLGFEAANSQQAALFEFDPLDETLVVKLAANL